MPNNFGISKHPCFCFSRCRKGRQSQVEETTDDKNEQPESSFDQEKGRIGEAAFRSNDPIQMKKVSMKFGEFKAVDKMTLSIQQDEILALLGHNGAGKTTAIYMLTGMLKMTSGDALIYGKSVRNEIDEVR